MATTVTYSVGTPGKDPHLETDDAQQAARVFHETPANQQPHIIRAEKDDEGQERASFAASTWTDTKNGVTTYHKDVGDSDQVLKTAYLAAQATERATRDADAFDVLHRDEVNRSEPTPQKTPQEALEAIRERNAISVPTLAPAVEVAKQARADVQDFAALDEQGKAEAAQLLIRNFQNRDYSGEFARGNAEAAQYVVRESVPKLPDEMAKLKDTTAALNQVLAPAGLTLDDENVSRVAFSKRNDKGTMRYDLDVTVESAGGPTMREFKNMDRNDLVDALGEKNADAIDARKGESGVLKGKDLAAGYGLSPDEQARRMEAKEARKAADMELMQAELSGNSIEHVDHNIDVGEALARAAANRERDRAMLEKERLGTNAEGKRIDIENLSEKAQEQDDANRLAANDGRQPNFQPQIETEREKNHKADLLEKVHRDYRVAGNNFYFKDRPEKLAFKDKGEKLVTGANDERVAFAMATMAEARGWKTIKVNGHPDFRREVWMEASLRGIQVKGFAPQERDLKDLEERRERAMRNSVEKVADDRKTSGPERAAPVKSEQHKVAEAVAAKVMGEQLKGKDPAIQQEVMQRIQQGLQQRAQAGRVPTIPVYDKAAPSKAREIEQTRPQVERKSERTR